MADGTLFGTLRTKDGRRPLRVVDLFCGAGGTSLGVKMGLGVDPIAAVNHWDYAIRTHAENHPATLHFREDVFSVAPWEAARGVGVDLLVGSPDCTHHSKAKGGKPLNRGRRALADVFVRWAREIRPRVIIIENVEGFREWGPLDESDRPIPERKGEDFRRWVSELQAEGYAVEWRLLRACDYGAPTSRLRLFVVARCDGQPIRWPTPTHGPGTAQPWHAASEVIDWSIPCRSIFGRKKPLAEATMRRIAAGVRKFVIESASPFIIPTGYGERPGQSPRCSPITDPLGTVVGAGKHALIAPTLALLAQGERRPGEVRAPDLGAPLPTVTSGGNRFGLVAAHLQRQFGASVGSALDAPAPTVMATGAGKSALVAAYIARHFTGAVGRELQAPLPTVTTVDHHSLVAAFLTKYYGTGNGQPVTTPLDTVTTRDRFALATVQIGGEPYRITDIGMRMLTPRELARAQGFPDSYILNGSKADQIAAIGNAVVPQVMAALVKSNLGDE